LKHFTNLKSYRWLKPGGIILPCTASLYMAPICDDEVVIEKINFWNDMHDVYGVNMSCVLPFARHSLSKEVSNINYDPCLPANGIIC